MAISRLLKRMARFVRNRPGQSGRSDVYGALSFRCNVCGAACFVPVSSLRREGPSCDSCGSSVRMRSIVHILSKAYFGESLVLPEFPVRKDIRGVGLSDWEGYAAGLAEKFDYRNTFFHAEPRLDITTVDPALEETLDFLIASDVFEHIPPPVSAAFGNSFRLLRPGGLFIFTVPYLPSGETVEHFPRLNDYEIAQEGSEYVIRNRTKDGEDETYRNVTFHGGPGATVEMRLFSEPDLLRHLHEAGFRRVAFHGGNIFEYGIYWDMGWSIPMSAAKTLYVSSAVDIALPEESGKIRYAIDRISRAEGFIEVDGWAFADGETADGSEIFVVLKSAAKTAVYSTESVSRPDVGAYHGRAGLDGSGFSAIIPTAELPGGDYRVGLFVRQGAKETFCFVRSVLPVTVP